MTPTLLAPDSTTACTDKSTTQRRAERFLATVPENLRTDLLHLFRLWSRDRETAGQVVDDFVARCRHDLPYVRDAQRRGDLKRLLHLLQTQRYQAVLLVGTVKSGVV